MVRPLNIAIVGDGIAGLATAIALLKHGFNVQVYEGAKALQFDGAGLTLTPNGLNSLDAIHPGIVELLKPAGSPLNTFILKDWTGEMIASQPITVMQQYGQPLLNIWLNIWLNIRRSCLQSILTSVLPPDVIRYQHRCVRFEQSNDEVKLFLSNGEIVKADLLIGADGIHSVVRQTLIGDGSPVFTDRISWQSVVKFGHEQLASKASTLLKSIDGRSFLFADVGEGYTLWNAKALLTDDFVNWSTNPKNCVLERFADWAEPVGAILEATPADKIVEQPICDRPPLPYWSEGRVVLLGEAAYSIISSQQDVNMAFEDAYELAECLSTASNIKTAFKAYENSRIPRTLTVYNHTVLQGDRFCQLDSETMLHKFVNSSQMSQAKFQEWLYCYHPPHRSSPVITG